MLYGLKAPDNAREPEWVSLVDKVGDRAAIEVKAKPVDRIAKRIAQRAASAIILAEAGEDRVDDRVQAKANDAYGRAMLTEVIEDWRGLGNADGKAQAFDTNALSMFLADDFLFDRAWAKIVLPVLAEEAEKNGYAPSPSGTGAGATRASGTASSSAKGPKRSGAKGARTASTRSKRAKPKTSGRSFAPVTGN